MARDKRMCSEVIWICTATRRTLLIHNKQAKSKRTFKAPRPWDLPRFCTLHNDTIREYSTIIILDQREFIVGLFHQFLHLATTNDFLDCFDLEMSQNRSNRRYIFVLFNYVLSIFGKRLYILSIFGIRRDLLKISCVLQAPSHLHIFQCFIIQFNQHRSGIGNHRNSDESGRSLKCSTKNPRDKHSTIH